MENRKEELMLRAIRNLVIQNKLLELQILEDRDPYIESLEASKVKNLEVLKGREDFIETVRIIEESLMEEDLVLRVSPMDISNIFGFDFMSFQKEVSSFVDDRDGTESEESIKDIPRIGTYNKIYSLIHEMGDVSGRVPDFLVTDAIDYFSSEGVEEFKKCNVIKKYFDQNPKKILKTASRK